MDIEKLRLQREKFCKWVLQLLPDVVILNICSSYLHYGLIHIIMVGINRLRR